MSAAGPAPLLRVDGLRKHFALRRERLFAPPATVRAVDDVSFAVAAGETLGIVGESGCGKSTTARLVMHLIPPDAGTIAIEGTTVAGADAAAVSALRRRVQMVFQDSWASLNPRLPVGESIAFGPEHHGVPRPARQRAHDLLATVGLDPAQFAHRYPHQLSGGQRQRINCARALAMEPRLLILDEAVSALDKSVEAQMLNLLTDLKRRLGLTYLFISHDLNVVRYMSDRVLVMYLGQVVEVGPVDELYRRPAHPYTQGLLASRPSMDPDARITASPLSGDPPNPVDPPSGCRFRTRCPHAESVCERDVPLLAATDAAGVHAVACHMARPGSGHGQRAARTMRPAAVLLALLAAAGADARAATIAVDVGHHARSPGATSARGLPEFGYNRALALRIGTELGALGHRVVPVGADGDAVELAARPRAARGAALFLSVHHDSVQPHLMETWTFEGETQRYSDRHAGYSLFVSRRNPAPRSSLRCATAIGAALRAAGFTPSRYHADPVEGENRPFADEANGVHYFDDLVVLRTATMPALLLEAGVIVNRDEELLLRDSDRQQRMAAAVARGADTCVRRVARRTPQRANPTR